MQRSRLLLLFLIIAACGQNPVIDGDINRLVVESILNPDNDQQTVTVSEATNVALSDGLRLDDLDKPVTGARVQVSGGGQQVTFVEVAPGTYRDTNERLRVVPGAVYNLEVRDGDNRAVFARTRVPGRPAFTSPVHGASFDVLTQVDFDWDLSEHAGLYVFGEIIPVCSGFNIDLGAFHQLRLGLDGHTTIFFRQWPNCGPDAKKVMNLRVFAADSAASAWLWPFESGLGRSGTRVSNVRNGTGVFGAMLADSVQILIEAPAPAD